MSRGGRSLVTGGAGFIGSQLVDALVARGEDVVVLDDLSTGRRENLSGALESGATLVQGTVADGALIASLVKERSPERVFHLAAQIDVRRSVKEPAFDAEVNAVGTINVLEAMRAGGSGRLVFVSTGGAIYGAPAREELPVGEDEPCAPASPYGQSKLAAEGYVDLFRRLHSVSAVTLRLANVYGPRQSSEGEAGVVAIFCGRLLRGEAPVVFGTGTQTRDYVYVADAVTAILAAEARIDDSGSDCSGPYNVGTGVETTVLELVELLARISGRSRLEPEMAPSRRGEVERIALDISRAERELGWRPATDLATGLELTYEAMRAAAAGGQRRAS